MNINTIIMSILQDVTLATIPVVVGFIVKFISHKLNAQQLGLIETLALNAVRFTEENGVNIHGQQKLDMASQWLVEQAEKLNIKLNIIDVEGFVLSALKKMRDEFKDDWTKSEQPPVPTTPVTPPIDVKPILAAIPMEQIQEYVNANVNGGQQ